MKGFLLDTSVWIETLRGESKADDYPEPDAELWLSAVVLEELYAGARAADRAAVEQVELEYGVLERIVIPDLDDWRETGLLLGRVAVRYGYDQIGRGRLTNDALIAVSAARNGLTVLTLNARDFARLAEFFPFRWQAATTAP